MKLIDKDAVLAEIRKRKSHVCGDDLYSEVKRGLYSSLEIYINTLEVKEVDLEKHLKEDIEDVFFDLDGVAVKGATHYLTVDDIEDIEALL